MAVTPICPDNLSNYRYLTCTNIETGITAAASGNQSNGYLLQAQASTIQTVANIGDAVILPKSTLTPAGSSLPGALGQLVFLTNNGANACQVYGSYPDTINGIATATGITLQAGAQLIGWITSFSQSTNVGTWAVFINSGTVTGTVTNTLGALTKYAVVIGNGGSDETVLASLGTAGQVLTSNGAGAAPSFQAGGASSSASFNIKLSGADLNSTADQAINGFPAKYAITNVTVTNSSGNATTAIGGIYTAASKGGSQVVYNGQSYSSLTGSTALLNCSFAVGALEVAYSASTLYFSLSTPQGSAMTADVYVQGVALL